MKFLSGLTAAALAAGLASAAHADVVLNTTLGPVAPSGTTTTDATGTRSTNPTATASAGAFSPGVWRQDDLRGGGVVGITTDYARAGNGSLFFSTSASGSQASLDQFFTAVPISQFGGASYDWYRDSSSTSSGLLAPAFRLLVSSPEHSFASLVFEPTYQQGSTNVATDSWQTSLISFDSTFWANPAKLTAPATATGDSSQRFDTLTDFAAANPGLNVIGVSVGVGSGWSGTFTGAVDNVSFSLNRTTSSSNFEVSQGVPEPATWALMLTGFGGLGAMLRRRRAVVRLA